MKNQTDDAMLRQKEDFTSQEPQKLTRKERRQRWKAAKKAKREEQKEFYRYAPALKRIWNLYLKKPLFVILMLAIVTGVIASNFNAILQAVATPFVLQELEKIDNPLSEEDIPKLYELSPLDEEGAKRIDALPGIGEDETWTICVYLVGADLEDHGENDLSYITSMMAQETREQNEANNRAHRLENIKRYSSELNDNGLELPAFFYYPDKPVAHSMVVREEVIVSERPGAASKDIGEMTAATWSDNIQIIIQTGGATRWSNQMVNPNRTQRFLYKSGEFSEVADLPLAPPAEPDTLADFLRFCKDEYPADHTMLVLWNHGGGPFGYGKDSIFNGSFSLKDIRSALSKVYRPNRNKPAFDIIGFDACLMSAIEVTHALDGFASYYCLSEESEPGNGWDYTPVLQAMTDDPTMSPAKVAQKVADSYMDFYMRENINQSILEMMVTFSVIDAKKAAELYDAYCDLCEAQLKDAVGDLSVLSEIGRCAGRATRYAGSDYTVFNEIDLGNYLDYMVDSYPEECSRVKELLGEAVLYHRENGGLSDSTGMAVYIPGEVTDIYGLVYFLNYIYDISDNDAVTALYYYKQAGCLNDELKDFVALLTDTEPKVLDVGVFQQFGKERPEVDDSGFLIPVSEELQGLIVDYELEIGKYDEESNIITYYGRDNCLTLDGEGYLVSDFDGQWICLDGQPLYVEIVSSTPAATDYRSHVLYNGAEAYLELSCDRDTDEISLTGVRKVPNGFLEDTNYLINTRSKEEIEAGAKITPIYIRMNYNTNSIENFNGKTVTLSEKTTLKREVLPAGYYLSTAVIEDLRGDSYYSAVVAGTVANGAIGSWTLDSRFYGRDY